MNNNIFFTKNPSKWKLWKDSHSAKKVNQYELDWTFIKSWWSLIDITRKLWFNNKNISSVCLWKRKVAHKFKWKYLY